MPLGGESVLSKTLLSRPQLVRFRPAEAEGVAGLVLLVFQGCQIINVITHSLTSDHKHRHLVRNASYLSAGGDTAKLLGHGPY